VSIHATRRTPESSGAFREWRKALTSEELDRSSRNTADGALNSSSQTGTLANATVTIPTRSSSFVPEYLSQPGVYTVGEVELSM
jgi:hypothetical protein